MVRTAVLFLFLALAGGAPHLAALVDLLSVAWAADQLDVGGSADPDGATATSDVGGHLDPDG